MVEARIDQLQADDRPTKDLGDLGVRPRIGAKTGSSQDHFTHRQQVALTLVDVPSLHRSVSLRLHPVRIGGGLLLALRVFESCHHRRAVEYQPAVGGVDHVGQAGNGCDEVDDVSQSAVGVAKVCPLRDRDGGVDRGVGVHPRVDRVVDSEKLRRRHDVVPNPRCAFVRCGGLTRRAYSRSLRKDRHKSTVWEGFGAIKHRSLLLYTLFIARNAALRQSVVWEARWTGWMASTSRFSPS